METGNSAKVNEPRHENRSRKQVQVFMICLAIATAIWFMIKLSKDYNYTVPFKVVYTNTPPGKTMNRKADSVFILTLRATGYHILYNQISGKEQTLTIDISQIKLKKSGSYHEGGLQTADLSVLIQSQLPTADKLTDIYPRNVSFRFENVFSKKVPVKPDIKIEFRKQFGVYGKYHIVPDSVVISGPMQDIQKVKKVTTPAFHLDDVYSLINFTLPIQPTDNNSNITIDQPTVRIMALVTQFTEASVTVPVSCDSLPKNYSINTYPPKVNVVYQVAVPDYKNVTAESFRVSINGRKAMQQAGHKLKVSASRHPSHVEIVRIEPDRVEFILNK